MTDYEKFKKVCKASGVPYGKSKKVIGKSAYHQILEINHAVERPRCKRPNLECLKELFVKTEFTFSPEGEFESIETKTKSF